MDRADPERAPQLILGTAGHIDHGKTALVRALTGVDTDRLPEEKARGITIELGFAALDLPGGTRLGVVDVPGHERLVRTMVAGATGIDLVLLVVAADEGVMPQTREHLAICELLGVDRAVVALTKVDLVDAELAELAEAEVAAQLEGTALAGAPVVGVSALTGAGLDALRAALAEAAALAEPRTPRGGPPRLPIDRAFAARGFGAVVTGSLVGAPLAVGDAVEIQPGATAARVRGLQRHGADVRRLEPGVRCAVNLHGVELETLSRGRVVTLPGALAPTGTLDVQLAWLDVAPAVDEPYSVELLAGTAERRARVAPVGRERLEPGSVGFARIHVDGPPLPALPGDRFVLRGFARTAMGGTTLGGGVILDAAPPRRRRSDPGLVAELEELASRDPARELAVRIARGGLSGVERARLSRDSGLAEELDAPLAALAAEGAAVATASGTWLASRALAELEERLLAALERFHREQPLQPGMPAGALRGRLPANVPRDVAELALARLAERGAVRGEQDVVRLAAHEARLDASQEQLAARILAQAREARLEPPALREWCERLGVEVGPLRDLLAHLERRGELVRAREDLWFAAEEIAGLRQRVLAHLREHGRLTTPDYKALIGTSRRTAVPLMELFDEQHVTARRDDVRLLHPAFREDG